MWGRWQCPCFAVWRVKWASELKIWLLFMIRILDIRRPSLILNWLSRIFNWKSISTTRRFPPWWRYFKLVTHLLILLVQDLRIAWTFVCLCCTSIIWSNGRFQIRIVEGIFVRLVVLSWFKTGITWILVQWTIH